MSACSCAKLAAAGWRVRCAACRAGIASWYLTAFLLEHRAEWDDELVQVSAP